MNEEPEALHSTRVPLCVVERCRSTHSVKSRPPLVAAAWARRSLAQFHIQPVEPLSCRNNGCGHVCGRCNAPMHPGTVSSEPLIVQVSRSARFFGGGFQDDDQKARKTTFIKKPTHTIASC